MMLSQTALVLLCLLPSFISALHAPAATANPGLHESLTQYSNARPTSTPYPLSHDLLRRQQSSSSQRTLLAAPDKICGYLGGVSDRPWGCSTGNCVFATPTPIANSIQFAGPGSVLCCDPSTGCPSSPAPTACVDNFQNGVTTTISGSADPGTLTCTSGLDIFCNTLTFATPSISAVFCNYLSNRLVLNATTTYTLQAARSFTPTVPIFAVSLTPTTSSTLAPSSVSSSNTPTTSTTAIAVSGGGKKVNNRAIIGVVFGSVVGLALWTALVVLFVRGRRARREEQMGSQSPSSEVGVPKPVRKA